MEKYISDFLKQLETKKSSHYIYSLRLKQFKRYYDHNHKQTPLTTLINKSTVERYGDWLRQQHQVRNNKKPLGKAYIHDLKSAAIRLLNHIAEQQKITPIPFYLKTPKWSEQYTPSASDFLKLISVECSGDVKQVQDMIYINSFIGLRIEELLSITTDSVLFDSDHTVIHFSDFKHSKARDVVLVDHKALELLRTYVRQSQDTIFNLSSQVYGRKLRILAGLALEEKRVTLYNADKEANETHLIKDVITSHCIRRYAIINNIAKYGISVAQTLSGHTNSITIERHYARDFVNKKAVLDIMRKK